MKTLLMNYCQRAYAAAMACEAYGCAAGYQLGFTETSRYVKNTELAKYQKKVVFPPNLGLLPVAIFTLGVTWRLVTARIGSSILRVAMVLAVKSGEKASLRPLPKPRSAGNGTNGHDDSNA
jgi:hypothetical protein